jgi:hypothetical protein
VRGRSLPSSLDATIGRQSPRVGAEAKVSEASQVAVLQQKAAPPGEVVLPAAGYALLAIEAAALVALHYEYPERSGGERWSYLLGWAGTASMVVMHVYSLRRRVRALRHLGRLRTWLHFHIFMGLQGALLVTYHSLHLHSAASIQGLNITCVAVVVASGIFGRYLYSLIPKSLSGDRLSALQIEQELEALRGAASAAPTPELGAAVAACERGAKLSGRLVFRQLVGEDLRARRALSELGRRLRDGRAHLAQAPAEDRARLERFVAAARRRVMLARRLATFTAADRLFRGWTVLHKPLTFILLGSTLLHIFAHYMFAAGMSG